MVKILLVADSIISSNLGCQLVSNSIREEISRKFVNYKLDAIPMNIYQTDGIKEKISDYDFIYINGEGIIGAKFNYNLYKMVMKILKLNNNVYFCNFSFDNRAMFTNNINSRINTWLHAFKLCKAVTVREPISYVLLKKFGIKNVKLLPDIGTTIYEESNHNRKKQILFGAGSILKSNLWLSSQVKDGFRKIILNFCEDYDCAIMDWPASKNSDGDYLWNLLGNDSKKVSRISGDYKNYFKTCQESILNFTGRHHGIVMSYAAGCPAFTFKSNMWKTEGDILFYDCGRFCDSTPSTSEEWISSLEDMLDNIEEHNKKIKNRQEKLLQFHSGHIDILLNKDMACAAETYPDLFKINNIKKYLNSSYVTKLLNI
tara:strand:+ start:516 stop:1631 length:1116 start_codon:yes stop_codon:yes gene_type:complete